MARQNCCFNLFVFFALFMTLALAVDYRPSLTIEVKDRTTSNHLEKYFENIEAENLYNTITICLVLVFCSIVFTSIIVCVTLWPNYFRRKLLRNSNGGSEV